jgi:hypothetical protein
MTASLWLSLALASAPPAPGLDVTRISAPLTREPAYRSGAPRYGLLVFGPRATKRVWVVVDGDTLYVDRNGNGDLTEPGERFALPKFRPSAPGPYAAERKCPAVVIPDGKLRHTDLRIHQWRVRPGLAPASASEQTLAALARKDPGALVYGVSVAVQLRELPRGKIPFSGRIRQSAGEDARGFLQFAARPGDAPVIHFGGPLEMALLARQTLPVGEPPGDLRAMVGTRGRGPGSFASASYDGLISEEAQPVADVEFPAGAGGKRLRARVTLPHRC